ncbi:hypothetical protein STENM36S_07661 [Streptomyces tendae]
MFWISKGLRDVLPFLSLVVSPGNSALTVEAYSRKSFFWSPERANSVRSYAEETCPGMS